MALGMEVGLGPGDFVFDGDPAATPRTEAHPPPPSFWPMFNCGQTAGWMKTPLGTIEVDLGPGHTVLDGSQLSSVRNGHSRHHLFGPCLLWPAPRSPSSATVELLLKQKTDLTSQVMQNVLII